MRLQIDVNMLKRLLFLCQCHPIAQVVKLVDTPDLGSGAARCVGSSPILGILF